MGENCDLSLATSNGLQSVIVIEHEILDAIKIKSFLRAV